MENTQDEEHLKLLSFFHYIVGGIGCFLACFPLIHVGIGLFLAFSGDQFAQNGGEAPPAFIGWIFVGMGLLFFILGQAMSISMIVSERYLSQRKKYMFSFIIANLTVFSAFFRVTVL